MDLDDVTAELYGLALDAFVAARDAAAKQAKSDGDAATAKEIRALRKPTTVAWLANQLARANEPDVTALLAWGEEMREATADRDGARLRELARSRRTLVGALVEAARAIVAASGQKLSSDVADGLRDTLEVAAADRAAGAQLRRGRLTQALQPVGFGVVAEDDAAPVVSLAEVRRARERTSGSPAPGSAIRAGDRAVADTTTGDEKAGPADDAGTESAAATGPDGATPREHEERAAERAEARDELAAAVAALAAADDAVDELESAVDDRRDRLREAEAETERLAAALQAARQEADGLRGAIRAGQKDLDRANEVARTARRRHRAARRRLDDADG